jgi:hypothetical protein
LVEVAHAIGKAQQQQPDCTARRPDREECAAFARRPKPALPLSPGEWMPGAEVDVQADRLEQRAGVVVDRDRFVDVAW